MRLRIAAVERPRAQEVRDRPRIVTALVTDAAGMLRVFRIVGVALTGQDSDRKGIGHAIALAEDTARDTQVERGAVSCVDDLEGGFCCPLPVADSYTAITQCAQFGGG